VEGISHAKNQLDSFSRFDRTPTCDRHRHRHGHRHRPTASTADAQHRAVKSKNVFSFLRTLKTWHYPHLLLRAVLRPRVALAPAVYLLPAGPTAANPPHAAAAGELDRRTDGRTLPFPIDRAPYTMRAVPITSFIGHPV